MINKLTEKPRIWLSLADCEELYQYFRESSLSEPLPPFFSRYPDRLESILGSVQLSYTLNEGTLLDISACYFNKFIRNQCFMNGNKRTGVLFTHFFLLVHDVDYTLTYKELFNFTAIIASASERGIKEEKTLEWSRKIIEKFTKDK